MGDHRTVDIVPSWLQEMEEYMVSHLGVQAQPGQSVTLTITTPRGVFGYHRPADHPPQYRSSTAGPSTAATASTLTLTFSTGHEGETHQSVPILGLSGLATSNTGETYYSMLRSRYAPRNGSTALLLLNRYLGDAMTHLRRCPMSYRWYKNADGYICGGGYHYSRDTEFQAGINGLAQGRGQHQIRVEEVNDPNDITTAVAPPPNVARYMPMHKTYRICLDADNRTRRWGEDITTMRRQAAELRATKSLGLLELNIRYLEGNYDSDYYDSDSD